MNEEESVDDPLSIQKEKASDESKNIVTSKVNIQIGLAQFELELLFCFVCKGLCNSISFNCKYFGQIEIIFSDPYNEIETL